MIIHRHPHTHCEFIVVCQITKHTVERLRRNERLTETNSLFRRFALRFSQSRSDGAGVISNEKSDVFRQTCWTHCIGLYSQNDESKDPNRGNVYYVIMQIAFLTRKFRNVERNLHYDVVHISTIWVSSLTLDCNFVFAIKAYPLKMTPLPGDWGGDHDRPRTSNTIPSTAQCTTLSACERRSCISRLSYWL